MVVGKIGEARELSNEEYIELLTNYCSETLKIFHLELTKDGFNYPYTPECVDFVIIAKNVSSARKIAAEEESKYQGRPYVWLEDKLSTVSFIGIANNSEERIVTSYR